MNLRLPPHLLPPHIARDRRGKLLKPEAIAEKIEATRARKKPKPEPESELESESEGDDVSPYLVIDSEPTDARVYLDNEKVGRTPLEVPLVDGEHELRVSKTGYKTAYYTVTEPSAIYAELEKR